jgi:hypothetical protein
VGHQVCYLGIIQIRHEEMRVAVNTKLGQMHNSDITAVTVHYISPRLRHLKEYAPLFLPGIFGRMVGNIVSVINDDRDFRERHKIR